MKKKDYVIEIMNYEQGELSDLDTLKLFSKLIKNGMAWSLQGHYGRNANHLINEQYLLENGDLNNEMLLDIGIL